jgi:hypothetical protein
MKEAETTVLIWIGKYIEGSISKLLMLTFVDHSTTYLFFALWLCAHTVRPTNARIPRIYLCFFKKILNFYVALLVNLKTTDNMFWPHKRTNGSIIIDSLTYIRVRSYTILPSLRLPMEAAASFRFLSRMTSCSLRFTCTVQYITNFLPKFQK